MKATEIEFLTTGFNESKISSREGNRFSIEWTPATIVTGDEAMDYVFHSRAQFAVDFEVHRAERNVYACVLSIDGNTRREEWFKLILDKADFEEGERWIWWNGAGCEPLLRIGECLCNIVRSEVGLPIPREYDED